MGFLDDLDRLRRESVVIKQAPWSFISVCVLALGIIWYGLHLYYSEKLAHSETQANQWKEQADYWKEKASHPEPQPSAMQDCPRSEFPHTALKVPKAKPSPPVTLQDSPGSAVSVNQQGGITAATLNIGTVDRALSKPEQAELAGRLTPFKGKTITIYDVNDNGETRRFAESLQMAFSLAGITATVEERYRYEDTPQKPMAIYGPVDERPFVIALTTYLGEKGRLSGPVPFGRDGAISIWIAPR